MEKTLSVVQPKKKGSNNKMNPKNKQQQLKVVYISNPMRVETSPSEFKGVVQELTGRDAADVPSAPGTSRGTARKQDTADVVAPEGSRSAVVEDYSARGGQQRPPESSGLSPEAAQDYVPELIEAFPAGVMPSNMWYD
ncbi:unnamed protein product [Cuscuta campestris]|uniref:VQ domain-containing protein n=2 Tax=Cuscuta sect. Cleistogrammica TaxID=1824901 RepID=A0A484L5V5_9ASTE|nr:hypothetical protein DM860_010616 [Cuscuta australis]VFQ71696.1 unnamed protein product [Cuscuta campestris]